MAESPRTHVWSACFQRLCWFLVNLDPLTGEPRLDSHGDPEPFHAVPIRYSAVSFGLPPIESYPAAIVMPVAARDQQGHFFISGADIKLIDQASGQDHEQCLDMLQWGFDLTEALNKHWSRISAKVKLRHTGQLDPEREQGADLAGTMQDLKHFTIRLDLEFIQPRRAQ